MHRAALSFCGIPGTYDLIDCPADQLPVVASRLRASYRGINVTIPHKQAIANFLDELTPEARMIHAVNTVRFDANGRAIGHNTDAGGFLSALETMSDVLPAMSSACIIGAGGAARAALWAVSRAGAEQAIIYARTQRDARLMRDDFVKSSGTTMQIILRAPGEAINTNAPSLIVNCTPLGLQGDEAPEWLVSIMNNSRRGQHTPLFFDMVYSRSDDNTPLVRKALEIGLNACDGRQMLIEQAALSFEFWTGQKVPSSVLANGILEGVR